MKNLPDEIWIKIYEYEGLFFELMKSVKHELKLITYQSRCYNCKLKNVDNNHICPIHWRWWQESIKYIKMNSITTNMTRISNGMWIWNDVNIPEWLNKLQKKINNKNKKLILQ